MVDCIKSVFEFLTGFCGLCAKWKYSMDKLEEDLNSLKKASDELNDRYLDVKMEVETAEQDPNSSLVILNEVSGWMGRVEVLQNEVDTILKQGDEETQDCFCGGRCPKNCRAWSKLHKMVTQKLRAVNDLMSKGHCDVVALQFEELPMDKAVGVESTFEELCSYFEDNQVGIIGLYGMEGVGKTTLLKKFNNDFLSKMPHYVVIWVVASKDAEPGKIQDDIRKKLRVEYDIWEKKTQNERARLLYNILNEKKFVLLFDDVWKRIDLLELGVPSPKNHECKIIFTTRSQEVCNLMDANKCIRVNCLAFDEAFELFKEEVGEITLENPLIFDLAKQVVDKCQGLPLTLCTVGRTMASKVTPREWKRAIEILKIHPSKVQGIIEDVYYLPGDNAVGVESTFEELCSCFEDKQVGIIGLYGMGGVGKSTLLKKFNNDFLSTKPHYVVIWVVATKDVDEEKIQDGIRNKFGVKDDIWKNKTEDERARLLYNILNKKKFVLLFDDVWKRIDLVKLGVPSPDNHECKIIFTTRLKGVCSQMGAKRSIRVNCLTLEQAFELFMEKVGKTTLENPLIFDLAWQVVDKCNGLPLALCTVGRAMANKVTPSEWSRALEILRTHPSKLQGIVEDIYYSLEFSYDTLSKSSKSCFLYCALFLEDDDISKEDIIWFWMAEGYLGNDIHEARKQGEDIISNLKSACLLEDGEMVGTIKMHDVIRDVALWIACDHDKKSRFISRDCSNTRDLDHAKWKEVEKLSMWGGDEMITNLSQKPDCPNLVSLLVRDTEIQVFPTEVFVIPRTIRVLDLSYNREIRDLPSEIGDYGNLEYLNLSNTGLRKLPEELKNLKKLRFLLLNNLLDLEIPKDVISSLLSLQAFSMISYENEVIDDDNDALLQELEGLDHLQEIRICVWNKSSVETILKSPKLQGRMCVLCVSGEFSLLHHDLISSLGKMEHLETLEIIYDYDYDDDYDYDYDVDVDVDVDVVNIQRSSFWEHELTIMLRNLTLSGCGNIVDLNWLIHAPHLEFLELVGCYSLKEVISEDFGTDAGTKRVTRNLFSSLTNLQLRYLGNLMSICRMALKFPCLEKIKVLKCPKLKKLPFNSQSALKNLRLFEGEDGCMDEMQWEDEATKHLFSSKFERTQW